MEKVQASNLHRKIIQTTHLGHLCVSTITHTHNPIEIIITTLTKKKNGARI